MRKHCVSNSQTLLSISSLPTPEYQYKVILCGLYICYSRTMAARGLRGVREWRRYIDHEGGARVGL